MHQTLYLKKFVLKNLQVVPVIKCFDANSKLGQHHIPGDPHNISENGRILEGILDRHALFVANGVQERKKGVITRARTTRDGEERSVIDLVIGSEDIMDNFKHILVDEEKKYALESITKSRKGIDI